MLTKAKVEKVELNPGKTERRQIISLNIIYMKVVIKKSTNAKKKLMAIFYMKKDGDWKKKKTVHFGSAGMSDYTVHGDKARRKRYLDRHRKNESWNIPMSAGSLSVNILWGSSTSKAANISAFKRKFNLR